MFEWIIWMGRFISLSAYFRPARHPTLLSLRPYSQFRQAHFVSCCVLWPKTYWHIVWYIILSHFSLPNGHLKQKNGTVYSFSPYVMSFFWSVWTCSCTPESSGTAQNRSGSTPYWHSILGVFPLVLCNGLTVMFDWLLSAALRLRHNNTAIHFCWQQVF